MTLDIEGTYTCLHAAFATAIAAGFSELYQQKVVARDHGLRELQSTASIARVSASLNVCVCM